MKAPGTLVSLGPHHGSTLGAFLAESTAESSHVHGYGAHRALGPDAPIEDIIAFFDAQHRGEGLTPGWVPATTWFWESEGELQGVINLRHRLTPSLEEFGGHIGYSVAPSCRRRGVATAMLQGALSLSRELGVTRALLTCDADNRGSARTIEFNGGRLEREAWHEGTQRVTRWYWIEVPV
jgi:predicted acetyltransferase